MQEWQEHQFNPGYYTGGRISPVFKHPNKPLWLGVLLFVAGLVSLIVIIVDTLKRLNNFDNLIGYIITNMYITAISFVLLISGLSLIKKSYKSRKPNKK